MNRPSTSGPILPLLLLLLSSLGGPATGTSWAQAEAEKAAPQPDGPQPDRPWRAGPFQASAADLAAAASEAEMPAGAPALMLYQHAVYHFERDGRLSFRRHWVYRVDDPVAFEEWSKTQVRWSPWFEEEPRIRARVILPGGQERWLGDDDLSESRAAEGREGLFGERRLVEARLPTLEPGSVVEEEVRLEDRVPGFAAGTVHRHYTAFFIPGQGGRLELNAPTNLALRYGVRRMPGVEPETEVADGRVRVRFEFGALPAVGPAEEGAPGHRPRFPHVAFSTGRDWQTVATRLSREVDESIARAQLDGLAGELPSAAATPRERLDRALALVRERLSHDGLGLDATPGLPVDPDTVIEKGRGDGLDLAVTLAAILRRVGIRAHVALVNASFGLDVEPRLPGLGLFDHALVRAEVDGGLWLDPSAPFARPGDLPLSAQGRFVLLAAPSTEKLGLLPASEPEDNLAVEQREVHFADFGPGRLIERCRYFGSAARTQRRITGSLGPENRRRGYQAYVHAFHHAAGLGVLDEGDPEELADPFELELEALDSNRVRTELETAVLEVPIRELARRLPPIVLEAENAERREEFVFPEPFVSEWTYVVHPPPGFRLVELPADRQLHFGPASFSQHFERNGRLIRGWLRFDVGQRLLSAHQFSELVKGIGAFLEEPPVELHFELAATVGVDPSRWHQTLAELRQAAEREPGRPGHRVRLSQMLLRTGLVAEARLQARHAVALAPRWGLAHWAVGITLQYDGLGRRFAPGAELETSRQALREAVRLSPNEPRIRADRVRLDERDDLGRRHGPGVDPELAIEGYRQWRRDFDGTEVDGDLLGLLGLLASQDRWSEVASEAETMDPSRVRDVYLLAARAVLEGPGAVLEGPDENGPDENGHDENGPDENGHDDGQVVRALISAREYATAAALLRALGWDSDPRLPVLDRARRFEELELHPDDPATPARRLLIALRFTSVQRDELVPSLGTERFEGLAGETVPEALLTPYRRALATLLPGDSLLPGAFADNALPPAARADLALASFEPRINGAPHLGYRLSLGATESARQVFVTVTGQGESSLRVVGTSSEPGRLGVEILDRLGEGDLPGARQWLDWAKELGPGATSELFVRLWNPDPKEPLDRRRAKVAAAVLAAGVGMGLPATEGTAADISLVEELQALVAAPERLPTTDAEEAAELERAAETALLWALRRAGDHGRAETLAAERIEAGDASEQVLETLLWAREQRRDWRGRVEAAERILGDGGEQQPDPHAGPGSRAVALRALLDVALASGDLETARSRLQQIRQLGRLEVGDGAREVLMAMLELPAPSTPEDLENAEPGELAAVRAAIEEALAPSWQAGSTLPGAADDPQWLRVEAARALELGRLGPALEALRRAVPTGQGPQLADLYLVGRLAEAAGFRETARERYSELLGHRDAPAQAPLYRLLAEKRIGGLLGGT